MEPRQTQEAIHAKLYELIKRSLASNDKAWHKELYDWMRAHGMEEQLLSLDDNQFIRDYVNAPENRESLRWRWQQKHGDVISAAESLILAAKQDPVRRPLLPLFLKDTLTLLNSPRPPPLGYACAGIGGWS